MKPSRRGKKKSGMEKSDEEEKKHMHTHERASSAKKKDLILPQCIFEQWFSETNRQKTRLKQTPRTKCGQMQSAEMTNVGRIRNYLTENLKEMLSFCRIEKKNTAK